MIHSQNKTQVIGLNSYLPCSLHAAPGTHCDRPARVAIAAPGQQPGAWDVVPVCYECAWSPSTKTRYGLHVALETLAGYAVPPGTFGDFYQYEVRRLHGTDEHYAVVSVADFGIIAAVGPLSEVQIEEFKHTHVAPWDEAISSGIIDAQDQYPVIWPG